jgi:hypothetical protein
MMSVHNAVLPGHAKLGGLAPAQAALLFVYGVVLWFAAAMAIRYGVPAGVFGPTDNIFVYAVTAPVCFLAVLGAANAGRLARGTLLSGITVACIGGLLGDAFALPWLPGFYGPDVALILPGVAWLFFGVACCLMSAIWLDRA